jgi:hypothetical protein
LSLRSGILSLYQILTVYQDLFVKKCKKKVDQTIFLS